ncbi:MAG TPA: mycofactocin precursor MftA [Sporichthyaceae bacterium]|jgi:mycofactocin precursor|nr:mycofactocin precursor MftA [Sporichthyaceae bacterium]
MLDANPNPEAGAGPADAELSAAQDVVVADLLVEDVSIDGMCGVY